MPTPINYLIEKFRDFGGSTILGVLEMRGYLLEAELMEQNQRIKDYNRGYEDAQCNHINDAENYTNEQKYINHEDSPPE